MVGLIGGLAQRTMGDTPTGRLVRTVAPALVMAIAMILTQLGIAPIIVTATYIALIGAIALACALAFGLGGRDAAADMVNSGYRKTREQPDTMQRDAQLAHERGQRDAQQARERAEAQAQPGGQSTTRHPQP